MTASFRTPGDSDEREYFTELLKHSQTALPSPETSTNGGSYDDELNPLPFITALIGLLVCVFGIIVGITQSSLALFFVIALLGLSLLIGGLFPFLLKLKPTVERIAHNFRERQKLSADKQQRHRTISDHAEEARGKRPHPISALGEACVNVFADNWALATHPITWLFILPIAVYAGCELIAISPPGQAVRDAAEALVDRQLLMRERADLLTEAQRIQGKKENLEYQLSQLGNDEHAARERLVSDLTTVTLDLVRVRDRIFEIDRQLATW